MAKRPSYATLRDYFLEADERAVVHALPRHIAHQLATGDTPTIPADDCP